VSGGPARERGRLRALAAAAHVAAAGRPPRPVRGPGVALVRARAARIVAAGGLAAGLLAGRGGAMVAQSTGAPARGGPRAAVAGARQLVVVTADGWDAITGTLRRYERPTAAARWHPVGDPVPVVLGRTGLAWGVGQGPAPADAAPKREGDGRSPAGAFPLLAVFGYGDAPAGPPRLPHHPVTEGTVCVDDPASRLYNAVVDSAAVPGARWGSAERMRAVAGYRQGVVVAYNGAWVGRPAAAGRPAGGGRPVAGRGSCIFLHVWDGPDRPTAGCTAMDAGALATVVAWLDPAARPVLVQLPRSTAGRYRRAWGVL
jgi:D-alanyl-D-alanine dipeptidase